MTLVMGLINGLPARSETLDPNHWGDLLNIEFKDAMLGEKLGSGVYRDVFVLRPLPTMVVKVERTAGTMNNALEWSLWNALEERKKLRKWLAPCIYVSQTGTMLIQERTYPLGDFDEAVKLLPKKVPRFLCDFKVNNWGRLANGKVVCHDYGSDFALGAVSGALKNPNWWE